MTKELIAAALLVLLILGSWGNLLYLDRLMGSIEDGLQQSMGSYSAGNTDAAHSDLLEALSLWLNADGYTHVFIRHSEIDAISDAFYDLSEAMLSGSEEADAAYEKLLYHLHSVDGIEHLTLRSIL